MSFEGLKVVMEKYRIGMISRDEMQCAFHLWQRSETFQKKHHYLVKTLVTEHAD